MVFYLLPNSFALTCVVPLSDRGIAYLGYYQTVEEILEEEGQNIYHDLTHSVSQIPEIFDRCSLPSDKPSSGIGVTVF